MYSSVTNENLFEFRGLSTDTKPIGLNCTNSNVEYIISNGSTFFEGDTSSVYMLLIDNNNLGTWTEI